MRSHLRLVAMLVGLSGAAASLAFVFSPLVQSLMLGSSIGLIVASPVERLASGSSPAGSPEAEPLEEARVMKIVEERRDAARKERTMALAGFDRFLEGMGKRGGAEGAGSEGVFGRSVDSLTQYYPEWDAEGRLRTFVLMEKVAKSLRSRDGEGNLDLAYRMLISRGDEATQLSHISLNGSVEKIYRDPRSDSARLAGTLLLMNREDEVYAKSLVIDAIHLWSDSRFDRLRRDFEAVRALGEEQKSEVLGLLEREMEKAEHAKDGLTARRAKQLWQVITFSDGSPSPAA